MNKNLIINIMFFLVFISFFGFNFLISFLGNILLIVILVPVLILLIALISFNSLKSKLNKCETCGTVSLGLSDKCLNCGGDLKKNDSEILKDASKTTVEIKAEEVQ